MPTTSLHFRAIGLMSGTSMDGVDAVLLETDGEYYCQQVAHASLAYPKAFRQQLKAMEQHLAKLPLSDFPPLIILSEQSTAYHQQAIEKLLISTNLSLRDVDVIGYHGQTLCHRPAEKFSLQIGDAQALANTFQRPVIFDLRQNDLAHGGQGAPLAPLYHQVLMQQKNWPSCAILNCGGIANLSVIRGTRYEDITTAFDTGPGNVLLDRFVREWTHGEFLYDQDGQYALKGNIDQHLVEILYQKTIIRENQQNYYDMPPPKSLDSQEIAFIPEILTHFPLPDSKQPTDTTPLYNGCATLAAFTAYTIAKSIRFIAPPLPHHWIIAGGGAWHPVIRSELESQLCPIIPNILLQTAENTGFSNNYLEAELIAWLAVRSIRNLPLTLPQTTGVKRPLSGGKLYLPT